jgi:hypothetical protein
MPEFKTPDDGVAYGEFRSRVDAETEKYFKKVPFTIKRSQ